MPELRRALAGAGFGEVTTYVQSGNAIVESDADAAAVERLSARTIESALGLRVDVVARELEELAAVLARDPFHGVAVNPKRYLVMFFKEGVPAGLEERLAKLAAPSESFAVAEREAYMWTPESVQRSKLWNLSTGAVATARNWTTVQALHDLLAIRAAATPPP